MAESSFPRSLHAFLHINCSYVYTLGYISCWFLLVRNEYFIRKVSSVTESIKVAFWSWSLAAGGQGHSKVNFQLDEGVGRVSLPKY